MSLVSLSRVVAPGIEPVTLASVKQHLRVEHNDEDDLITEYIESARYWVEGFLQRALITQNWRAEFDEWPTWDDVLPKLGGIGGPVQSFVYDDDSETEVNAMTAEFWAETTGTDDSCVYLVDGRMWPVLGVTPNPIRIVYKVGYGSTAATVPAPIRMAIRQLVEHQYRNRGAIVVGTIAEDMPMGIVQALTPFRLYSVL